MPDDSTGCTDGQRNVERHLAGGTIRRVATKCHAPSCHQERLWRPRRMRTVGGIGGRRLTLRRMITFGSRARCHCGMAPGAKKEAMSITTIDGSPSPSACPDGLLARRLDTPRADAPVRLIVLDHDPLVRAGLQSVLQSNPRIDIVAECESLGQVPGASLSSRPEVMVTSAHQLGQRFRAAYRQSPVLREHPPALVTVMASDDAAALYDAVRCDVRGFVDRAASHQDLAPAVLVARAGGTYLSPTIAAAVIRWVSSRIEQERMPSTQVEQTLTDRELEVLKALGEGVTNIAIARRLRISEATVRSHTYHILAKLGLTTRTEAALIGQSYASTCAADA